MISFFFEQLIWALGFGWHHVMAIKWFWWPLTLAAGVVCAALRAHLDVYHIDSMTHAQGTSSSCCAPVVFAGILGFYLAILFTVTVFDREPVNGGVGVNLDVFGTWLARAQGVGGMRYELFVNACMLMPFGFLLPAAMGCRFRTTILLSLGVTLAVEIAQLVTVRGWFELSDFILNVFGAAIGYGIYATLHGVNNRREVQPAGKHFRW